MSAKITRVEKLENEECSTEYERIVIENEE